MTEDERAIRTLAIFRKADVRRQLVRDANLVTLAHGIRRWA
ncbi:hypothetical protein [Burkholderia sp. BCC0322]|nr:hypothetical protein [Burkholderia sp. BCC0322]